MHEILKERGLKATPARLAILEIFKNSKVPLNAEKIYKELKRCNKEDNINEATVYRTLTSLQEGGILKEVDFRKDSAYFELAGNHHHHITCVECDTVEDFNSKEVEKALGVVVSKSSQFINVKDHSLELFGVCRKCFL